MKEAYAEKMSTYDFLAAWAAVKAVAAAKRAAEPFLAAWAAVKIPALP